MSSASKAGTGTGAILEQLRAKLGYVDYLGASCPEDYPFAGRLYPGAIDAIRRLRTWGVTVILSDGDVVFQPRKIQRSGWWAAVEGQC